MAAIGTNLPKLQPQQCNAARVMPELFERAINFKAVAANTEGTIYDFELIYAGILQLKNISEQALGAFQSSDIRSNAKDAARLIS